MPDIQVGEGTTPTPEQQRKKTARQAMQGYSAALDDLTTNWSGLTVAQQREALRTMLIILARGMRWLMK
jgi:uncharacterized membrane protein